MLEQSLYSAPAPTCYFDFELKLTIDECPVRIWPERTRISTVARWECCCCGYGDSVPAAHSWSQEALLTAGKLMAYRHVAETHPGPTSRALFETF